MLLVGGGALLALAASKLTDYVPVPAPAIFLLAAAVASDLFPDLADRLSILHVERIAVVALVVILFDGGVRIGRERFRRSALAIGSIGILGTFGTAAIMGVGARYLLDLDWTTAGILGAALAPTDPAVMFSVLGKREIAGRTGTILEGESGVNDPVGIALMIGMVELATTEDAGWSTVVVEFSVEMAVGLAFGVVGGLALAAVMRRLSLGAEISPLLALCGPALSTA